MSRPSHAPWLVLVLILVDIQEGFEYINLKWYVAMVVAIFQDTLGYNLQWVALS